MAEAAGHTPFAVFNRTANPVIRAVLRSPLHPLISSRLALITVTGRVSGREYTFPVAYERDGDTVRVEVGWPERKRWWRNLTGPGAAVEVRIAGVERSGHGVAVEGPAGGVEVVVSLNPGGCRATVPARPPTAG